MKTITVRKSYLTPTPPKQGDIIRFSNDSIWIITDNNEETQQSESYPMTLLVKGKCPWAVGYHTLLMHINNYEIIKACLAIEEKNR